MNGYGSRPYYGYAYTIPSGTLVTSLPNLTNERKHSMGASTDTYAIIAGGHVMGRYSGDEVSVKTVEGYNSSLTKSVASSGMDTATWFGTSIKFGSYALFAGGTSNEDRNDGYTISNQATAFSGSMTRVYFPSLSYQRMNLASSVVGDYVLFAGGKPTKYSTGEDSATDVVEIFDKSFTKVYGVSNLPNKTSNLVGASDGNYALFGGGEIYIPGERNLKTTDIVEAYTLV